MNDHDRHARALRELRGRPETEDVAPMGRRVWFWTRAFLASLGIWIAFSVLFHFALELWL